MGLGFHLEIYYAQRLVIQSDLHELKRALDRSKDTAEKKNLFEQMQSKIDEGLRLARFDYRHAYAKLSSVGNLYLNPFQITYSGTEANIAVVDEFKPLLLESSSFFERFELLKKILKDELLKFQQENP